MTTTTETGHEETGMATIYRQGDVLIRRVRTVPADAQKAPAGRVAGRHVLAYGEVTGHHHSVAVADAELLTAAERVYLQIMTETAVEHQEHASITLTPGVYEVTIQREYTSADMAPRRVAD